jgi:Domain of unknown function (DUF4260)
MPRLLLRAEGLALLAGTVALYLHLDFSLLALALLALAPDISFLGYVAGPRAGAVAYDAVHTTIGPIALGTVGVLADADVALEVALIWLAHIGGDRALGYGLKYPSAFSDTHLQRV